MDLPYKVVNAIVVNTTLYFMSNLRREPGPFFFFLLVAFAMTMAMSMFFRLFASMTKTQAQALAPSGIILLCLVLYTGFAIPVSYMRGYVCYYVCGRTHTDSLSWARWIRRINPVSYGFEAVMVNEFHGRSFGCSSLVPSGPSYENITPTQQACAVTGSTRGANVVDGTTYVQIAFQYDWTNRWRNFGIIVAMVFILLVAHLVMSEVVASERSKGEVLVFQRSKMRSNARKPSPADEEGGSQTAHKGKKFDGSDSFEHNVQKQVSIFHWEQVNYEVQIKDETRKILNSVDGWIKPGTLTALMVCFEIFVTVLTLANISAGRFRRWKDHSPRCTRESNDHGCHFRQHDGRWTRPRRILSAKDGLRHAARSTP